MEHIELEAIADAVEELRAMLPMADEARRKEMFRMLASLREMAISILDDWMAVEEAIEDTYAQFSEVSHEEPVASEPKPDKTPEVTPTVPDDRLSPFYSGPITVTGAWLDESVKQSCQLRKALGFFDLEMYDEAADAFSKVAELEDEVGIRIYLSLSHLAAGRIDEAERALLEASQRVVDDVTRQAVLEVDVQIRAAKQDWHGAIHQLYQLLETNSNKANVWFNLGISHLQLHEFSSAERCFAQSYARNPDDEVLVWQAFALVWNGNFNKARQIAQMLSTSSFSSPIAIRLVVVLFLHIGFVRPARKAIQDGMRHHETEATALYLHALVSAMTGNISGAIALCKRSSTLERNLTENLELLGICLYLNGDLERAKRVFNEIFAQHSNPSSVVRLLLARVAALEGNYDTALQHFESVQQTTTHPTTLRLAALYEGMTLQQTDPARAGLAYEKAMYLGLRPEVIDIAKMQHDA